MVFPGFTYTRGVRSRHGPSRLRNPLERIAARYTEGECANASFQGATACDDEGHAPLNPVRGCWVRIAPASPLRQLGLTGANPRPRSGEPVAGAPQQRRARGRTAHANGVRDAEVRTAVTRGDPRRARSDRARESYWVEYDTARPRGRLLGECRLLQVVQHRVHRAPDSDTVWCGTDGSDVQAAPMHQHLATRATTAVAGLSTLSAAAGTARDELPASPCRPAGAVTAWAQTISTDHDETPVGRTPPDLAVAEEGDARWGVEASIRRSSGATPRGWRLMAAARVREVAWEFERAGIGSSRSGKRQADRRGLLYPRTQL